MIDDRNARDVQELLAANLRRFRIARHLSLSELARATTMSKATLSGIENGRANPTVDTLSSLADALRVSVAELLSEQSLGEVRIVRAAEGRVLQRDGIAHRVLDGTAFEGSLELAEIELHSDQVQEVDARPAGARASLYVLAGPLVAGPVERSTELGTGDYIAFPADTPHGYAAGRRPARALALTQIPG
jgi:transcriptional regulator with XRE-family HTH domain